MVPVNKTCDEPETVPLGRFAIVCAEPDTTPDGKLAIVCAELETIPLGMLLNPVYDILVLILPKIS